MVLFWCADPSVSRDVVWVDSNQITRWPKNGTTWPRIGPVERHLEFLLLGVLSYPYPLLFYCYTLLYIVIHIYILLYIVIVILLCYNSMFLRLCYTVSHAYLMSLFSFFFSLSLSLCHPLGTAPTCWSSTS